MNVEVVGHDCLRYYLGIYWRELGKVWKISVKIILACRDSNWVLLKSNLNVSTIPAQYSVSEIKEVMMGPYTAQKV
jgi:hypothetical protein